MMRSERPVCSRSNLDFMVSALHKRRTPAPLAVLIQLLQWSPPSLDELRTFIRFDAASYARHVSENHRHRMLVICWLPGQISPIHDHAGSTCAVLVVSGTATETRYTMTDDRLARPTGRSTYGPGTVFGGQDGDIHALGNSSPSGTGLVTCHIYSPPLVHMNLYKAEIPDFAAELPAATQTVRSVAGVA